MWGSLLLSVMSACVCVYVCCCCCVVVCLHVSPRVPDDGWNECFGVCVRVFRACGFDVVRMWCMFVCMYRENVMIGVFSL